ncbi:MAG: hypothetical protein EZS28_041061, partial [Streblomastix strix]
MLVLASLSLGFPIDIGEQIETIHGSTTVGQTLQKSANAPCSLSVTSGGPYITVDRALQQTCADGYEITLVNQQHVESLVLDKQTSILVKGTVRDSTQTIWSVYTDFSPATTIQLKRGALSIVNIDFQFNTVGANAYPSFSIISVQPDLGLDGNPVDFPTLVVNNSNFQGLGKDSTQISQMINVANANQ